MVKFENRFENRKNAQDKESTQEEAKVQKEGRKRSGRTIHSQAIYLDKDNMCNRTPPTPARSISPDQDIIPSPPSLLSSNLQAVCYSDAAAIYGQAQWCVARQGEEEITPKDSTSTRVSPTHGITNSLEVLALVRDGTLTNKDVVMDHNEPQGFKEALQSF